MSSLAAWTAADLIERFGPIPIDRVRHPPSPGSATEADVIRLRDDEKRLYELVDGVLLEKAVGFYEAYLATVLVGLLKHHVDPRRLGIVVGADGMLQLAPGLVRIPDVAYFSRHSLPDGKVPREPLPRIAPDLAIEVISRGNTAEEMQRKLRDYFAAGCLRVWYVYPEQRRVHAFTSPQDVTIFADSDSLRDEELFPEFTLLLSDLFAEPDLG